MRAEVAGAGFAGLAAAAALARAGWRVRVHEAADAPRSVGAGIYVHPFAQDVLAEIGALEAVERTSFVPTARHIHIDGTQRSVTDVGGRVRTTTRAVLHAAVLAAAIEAGVELATRSRAIRAEPAGTLMMEDGRQLEADLVVAADGVGAMLAREAGFALERSRHEDGVTRVLMDRAELRGATWDAIHDFYDYRHRPLRVLYTPCGPDVFYFCLTAPAEDRQATAMPVETALWCRSFPILAPTLARIGDLGRHDRYTTTVMERWSNGRVAVIGDAAHAMPSALGQGAGVSMLNAVRMAQSVADGDVPAGLAAWEATTRPVVERWQADAEAVARDRSLTSAVHPGTDFATERQVIREPAAMESGR